MADPRHRDEIAARRAALTVTVAGPRATLEAVAPLLTGTVSGAAQVWAYLAGAHSLARMGRCQEAMTMTERGHRAHVALGEPMEWYPWFHLFNRSEAQLSLGRLRDAEAVARREYETGLAEASPEAQACFALQLAKVNLACGRVRTAARHAREAVGVFRPDRATAVPTGSVVLLGDCLRASRCLPDRHVAGRAGRDGAASNELRLRRRPAVTLVERRVGRAGFARVPIGLRRPPISESRLVTWWLRPLRCTTSPDSARPSTRCHGSTRSQRRSVQG